MSNARTSLELHILSDELIESACSAASEPREAPRRGASPFGAAPNTAMARRMYKIDLARQLAAHEITMPRTNLFPTREIQVTDFKEKVSGCYSPASPFSKARAIGFTRADVAKRRPTITSREDVELVRLQVALHEMTHHATLRAEKNDPLAAAASGPLEQRHLHRYKKRYGARSPYGPVNRFQFNRNIRERQAEGASWLYLLSNYEGGLRDCFIGLRDSHERNPHGPRITHNYHTTLRAVLREFLRHPVKGLDLVECAEGVSRVIHDQRGLVREQQLFAMANKVYFQRTPLGYLHLDNYLEGNVLLEVQKVADLQLRPYYDQAATFDRLFSLTPQVTAEDVLKLIKLLRDESPDRPLSISKARSRSVPVT